MGDISRPEVVDREYATVDRLVARRLDRTGWLRGVEEITVLLEAVGGNGDWAAVVAAADVVCVDRAEAAVEAARDRGLQASRADIAALPFADESFDVVMCNWVLYHLDDLDRGLAELARVLRPGGRLVGGYNLEGHLHELWSRVYRWPPDSFDGENGGVALARHFARVERRDTHGEVLWESRDALQAYLDAYRELAGPLAAPDGPYPFRASRRNCVFVAEKATSG